MFVEASAIAAMLGDERRTRLLAGRLQAAATRATTAPEIVAAVERVAAETSLAPAAVAALAFRLLDALGVRTVSLPASLGPPAAAAMDRFGRSFERPNGLSAGECLAYAAARYYRLPLLFADPRFADTDIEPA